MLLQIIVLLLIGAIVAFYAFVEGFYSATVMAVCCVLAAVISFNFFEPIAGSMAGAIPRFAEALSLGLMFAFVLAVLRISADKFLGGMVHVPYTLDRVGGGAMGALTGLIVIGVLVACLRLLPFGPYLVGFQQVGAVSPSGQIQPQSLWLQPDRFTVGLVEIVSGGSLSCGHKFTQVHPDFIAEQAGFNNFADGTRTPFADQALSSVAATMPDGQELKGAAVAEEIQPTMFPEDLRPSDALQARSRFFAVVVCLKPQEDETGLIITATQAQLTCARKGPGDDSPRIVLAPIWLVDQPDWRAGKWEKFPRDKAWRFKPDKNKTGTISLVFSVPKDCQPLYLTVRKNTRTELTMPKTKPPEEQ